MSDLPPKIDPRDAFLAAHAPEPAPSPREARLASLLAEAGKELRETLVAEGGCDHPVGICVCGLARLVEEIRLEIEPGYADACAPLWAEEGA